MVDIAFAPARRLAAMVRRRKIGCLELLDHYLDRVKRYNPVLNAIIATDLPAARKRARSADRALAKGKVWGPFHGVPMTVKEAIQVAGLPTTFGAPQYRDNIARNNALVVDRWLKAGAIVFGKTNVPIWLMDGQSLQRYLRRHQKSVGSCAHAGRLVGRLVRRGRRRTHRHRGRQRHRLFDPQPGPLLRHFRP